MRKRVTCINKLRKVLLFEKACRANELKQYNWEIMARESQKLPKGNWRIWIILAGRGFGKTRTGAETIRKFVNSGRYKRIALIANTCSDAREVMVEGQSGLINITPRHEGLVFEPSKRLLTWPNGANARIYSAENPEQLRGPQFDCIWVDELAKFKNALTIFNQMMLCLRLGKAPKIIITSTPRPTTFIKSLCKMKGVVITKGSTYENEKNLSSQFLEQIKDQFEGSSLGAQEIHAEIIDNEKSWWTHSLLDKARIEFLPQKFKKIVVSVDPSITNNKNSDETGIIVAGMDFKGYIYILDDGSVQADALDWCKSVVKLYQRYGAHEVIVETNAGGDLTRQMMQTLERNITVKKVYARESKSIRAEPVLAMYQQNRIFHAKLFPKLEEQMLMYPDVKKSPDRLDALVWAANYLAALRNKKYEAWSA